MPYKCAIRVTGTASVVPISGSGATASNEAMALASTGGALTIPASHWAGAADNADTVFNETVVS